MKIAAFNVENLFDRAKAFNEEDSVSQKVLKNTAELNSLMEKTQYSPSDIAQMKTLITALGLTKSDKGPFVIFRKIRGRFIKRPRNKPFEIVATGRDDFIGWVELKTAPVDEIAIQNTGRVLRDVDADILAVIEAEDRISLKMFSDRILKEVGGNPYEHVMVIDGNDERGIDVGIMTRDGFEIENMRSHIHDLKEGTKTPIFSRDCPEYQVRTPDGEIIWIIPNHFKSKYGGNDTRSQQRRKNQAKRTADIYNRLISEGNDNVVVLGDLNDTPDSDPLKPLLKDTDLKDVTMSEKFNPGEFAGVGTFGLGNDNSKIDYLLLSPKLFARIKSAGLFRKGAWPGSRPKRWATYPEIQKKIHVASDHHVIWAEII